MITKKLIITTAIITGLSVSGIYTYNEFDKLKDENKGLTEQVSNLSDLIVDKDKLISEKQIENDVLKARNQELTNQVDILNKSIKQKDESINSLKLRLKKAMDDGVSR